jgi:hypothetical protein
MENEIPDKIALETEQCEDEIIKTTKKLNELNKKLLNLHILGLEQKFNPHILLSLKMLGESDEDGMQINGIDYWNYLEKIKVGTVILVKKMADNDDFFPISLGILTILNQKPLKYKYDIYYK